MAEADPAIANQAANSAAPSKKRNSARKIAVMLAVPVALAIGGFSYWSSLQGKVWTDNAYLKQDKVSISAEISGKIVEVGARENETVQAGDMLFKIDPQPYQLNVAQADAEIATAQADVTALSNDTALSGAEISAATEDIAFAQATLKRQQALWERQFTTKADLEVAEHAVAQARERLRIAQARQREAQAKLAQGAAAPGQNPKIATARARRASAQYNLERTEIRAPVSGRVGEAERLHPGQQIVAGLPVLTLVSTRNSYIEANFKETDLDKMAIGQKAHVAFDAYPGLVLKGHVASIGAGTGSEFSVLPAQNATGNWVKVTQRVPVRITLDEKSPRDLIAGLSTQVTVFTGKPER